MQRGPAGWKAVDAAILVGLVIAGLAYFGQYYDCGFNIGDEGSIVLISARLLDGERPFVDVVLGYGLLWCYPLVLLFEITGVSFIAARIYFLALALITSLLAFLAVRQHTGRRGVAAAVGLLVLAMPGTLHKSYIPLIVVANMLCLPSFERHRQVLGGRQVFGAGLVAAISYHIRPDLGLVAALVLIVTLATHAVSRAADWRKRFYQSARLSALFGVAALVPTVPLLILARVQGFFQPFLTELYRPIKFLSESMSAVAAGLLGFARENLFTGVAWAAPAQPVDAEVPAAAGKTLARIPWDALWQAGPHRSLAVLTYLPLLSLALMAAYACLLILRRRHGSRPMVADDTVGMLALLGLCVSAFPQFFLFRPDAAHLSQFMPGYMVLAGVGLGRWLLPVRGAAAASALPAARRRWLLVARWPAIGLLVLHVGFYVGFALPRPATGSIALAGGRTERFAGAGGVDVAVSPWERKLFTRVTRVVDEHTGENDTVLCFPYCPGFNVMTQRKTFARRLYVDDGMLFLDPGWQQQTIEWIEIEQVPLIIVQEWAPNGTEISRFTNWATEVMAHLDTGYQLVKRFGNTRFYRRAPALDGGRDPEQPDAILRLRSSGAAAERRFTWRSPARGLLGPGNSSHNVRADPTAEQTDAYLRALDVADFVRRGSDLNSPRFDLRRVAEQLGRSVDELVDGRDFDFERLEEVERRLVGVDRERALRAIFERLTGGARSNTERHAALGRFLARAIHKGPLNPTYRAGYLRGLGARHPRTFRVEDPLVLLELGEGRSDRVASLAVDLWRAAGMEARLVMLNPHIVAELHYDGGWHYLDVVAFGGAGMVKNPDGTVPSLAELSRAPLLIDRPASYVEPVYSGAVKTGSRRYPSYGYFGVCRDCRPVYRYKIGSRRQQALDLQFGWCARFTRAVDAKDIVLSSLPERYQPGAPRFVGVDVGAPEKEHVTVGIRWRPSRDRDGDLAGYRVFVSRESRGWSYDPEGAAPAVLPYWSHPTGWDPSMFDRLSELPKSEVALVTIDVEQVRLTLDAGHTYYVTVMPFDAHGEAVGREIYRASQELEITLSELTQNVVAP